MSNRNDKEYLKDILEAADRIKKYTSTMQFEEFLEDIETQDAVLRNIEIIGEAAKKSQEIKKEFSGILWKEIADNILRDIKIYWKSLVSGLIYKLVHGHK